MEQLIYERFKKLSEKYPDLSSFIIFGRAIRGRRLGKLQIGRFFEKAVDRGDYSKSDKEDILNHFYQL